MNRVTKAEQNTKTTSYGQVARRIGGWTSNGLFTAIVVVAALAFGRQVFVWWSEGKPRPAAAGRRTAPPVAAGDRLQFGAADWSMVRKNVAGDGPAATTALVALCRELIQASAVSAQPPCEPPSQAFLDDLAARTPVAQAPGKWQLFALDRRFPLVVGVVLGVKRASRTAEKAAKSHVLRDAHADGNAEKPQNAAAPARTNLASGTCRVLIWGMGLPVGPGSWTLYAWQPCGTGSASVGTVTMAGIPLPPESVRILSIDTADGGTVAAFVGPSQPQAWRQFYAAWFAAHGWTIATGWQERGVHDYARFLAPAGERFAAAEIRFAPDDRGQLRGVLVVTANR
jgi:hypothetical protein